MDAVTCPDCQGPMVPRMSARGKFWGCKRYPACKGTRDAEGASRAEQVQDRDTERARPAGRRYEGHGSERNGHRHWD